MHTALVEVFQIHPLLISNHNFTEWNGYIFWAQEREILVSVSCPKFPSLEGIAVSIPAITETRAAHYHTNLQKIISRSKSFLGFLNELNIYMAALLPNESSVLNEGVQFSNKSKFFELADEVLSEITEKVGLSFVSSFAGDLTEISLSKVDECSREHLLKLKIPVNYPKNPPEILSIDLPEVVLSQFYQLSVISHFYTHFVSVIQSLQDFWRSHDVLRLNSNVLEPREPMLKDTSWKIAITNDVFALLTLNPLDVRACPVVRIMGNRKESQMFQAVLERNAQEQIWNCDKDVLENLARVLEISSFPPPAENTEENLNDSSQLFQAQECCICFTSRSEDNSSPHKYCNNEKCNAFFHFGCLLEWFQSLPTNDTDSNYISGDCLNCGSKIVCTVKPR